MRFESYFFNKSHINNTVGVFPEPPIIALPTPITGIPTLFFDANLDFKNPPDVHSKLSGSKTIEKMLNFFSYQNLGALIIDNTVCNNI